MENKCLLCGKLIPEGFHICHKCVENNGALSEMAEVKLGCILQSYASSPQDDKYICLDCGYVFEEPNHYCERHGFQEPPYEEWDGCPMCGGAYAQAMFCDECNEPIVGTYVKVGNNNYCENCYEVKEISQ